MSSYYSAEVETVCFPMTSCLAQRKREWSECLRLSHTEEKIRGRDKMYNADREGRDKALRWHVYLNFP